VGRNEVGRNGRIGVECTGAFLTRGQFLPLFVKECTTDKDCEEEDF